MDPLVVCSEPEISTLLAKASTPDCNLRVLCLPTGNNESWLQFFEVVTKLGCRLVKNNRTWNPSQLSEKDFDGTVSLSFKLGTATATSTLVDFENCEIDLDPMELRGKSTLTAVHQLMGDLASKVRRSVGFSIDGKLNEPIFVVEPDGKTLFYMSRVPEPFV